MHHHPRTIAVLIVVAVIALVALSLAAGRIARAGFSASIPQTQHLVINSDEVIVQDSSCSPVTGFSFGITGSGACLHYVASIHVPDGSTITSLQATYEDTAGAADLVIGIASSDLGGTSDAGTPFRVDSVGTPGKTTTTVTGTLTVDNTLNHYHLEVRLPDPGLKFYSAVITYTTPGVSAFGDIDCNGSINSVDALKILRFVVSLPVSQNAGCPVIGS